MKSRITKIEKSTYADHLLVTLHLEIEDDFGTKLDDYCWSVEGEKAQKILDDEQELGFVFAEATEQGIEYIKRERSEQKETPVEELDLTKRNKSKLSVKNISELQAIKRPEEERGTK